ncbi:hypothetical protein O0I10_009832 [Lichtheimia ornata]|uniref:Uncharacterized protein n=1 Tax=Lichtheimia ornata TaxID=688661 RepID=A0AAD7UX16_9FUNG|nr:uncharacterized protein O0I10_009832 [Lichtheimia ornata]KAJ8654526.1 hypothetical protein O0I10_009832 [Lichtheimia ornata]
MFADILHRTLLRDPIFDELEDTFIHDAVSDILDVIFGEDRQLSHQWPNTQLTGIELVAEINPPPNYSKENVCNDKVKLGHEMKSMLQTLKSLKVHDPRKYVHNLFHGSCVQANVSNDGNAQISACHQDPRPPPPRVCC